MNPRIQLTTFSPLSRTKLSIHFLPDTREYRVRVEGNKDADYFTDSAKDALDTCFAMALQIDRTKLDQVEFTKSNFHLTPNTIKAFRDAFSTNPILRPLYHTESTLDEILAGFFH